jgi:NTE family protein
MAELRFDDTDYLHPAVPGKIVLVMQGGGAQAAYEGGVYQALHQAGIEPDWVIGTSIGAINGSIIAGNEVASRLQRLREFWSRIESRPTWPSGPMFGNAANQLTTLLTGVPGFFSPNAALLWGPEANRWRRARSLVFRRSAAETAT